MAAPKPIDMQWVRTQLVVDTAQPSGLRWLRMNQGRRTEAAGSRLKSGYWSVGTPFGKVYAHRLVWALQHGRDPGAQRIDHKDMDKGNNHPSNLRLASMGQNAHNTTVRAGTALGIKGLTIVNGWYLQAQVTVAGVKHRKGFGHAGYKENIAAAQVWLSEVRNQVGEFARD